MAAPWPGYYADQHGREAVTVQNGGQTLAVRIRGVRFIGADFDILEPDEPPPASARLVLCDGALCSCTIECDVPVQLTTAADVSTPGVLRCRVTLGAPRDRGRGDRVQLQLAVEPGDILVTSSGTHGVFETALIDVQRQLPPGLHLKTCISCAFSDYFPAGSLMFGGLACFRDNRAAYRTVTNKRDLFSIWDTRTEYVQETYLCPEYERRGPHAGYRGGFPEP
jgi:Family of unknown function (DUF6304)